MYSFIPFFISACIYSLSHFSSFISMRLTNVLLVLIKRAIEMILDRYRPSLRTVYGGWSVYLKASVYVPGCL